MVMRTLPKSLPSKPQVRKVPAGEFKAKCLGLLDEVDQGDLEIVVTKRGKPVARLVAVEPEEKTFVPVWGRSPQVKILGDIMEPMYWPDATEKWDRVMGEAKKPKRKKAK